MKTTTIEAESPQLAAVAAFYEAVFSGTADESPAHRAEIRALIEKSFTPGYTYNGGHMPADSLVGFRDSLFKRFAKMTFTVTAGLSGPADTGTTPEPTAVAMKWNVQSLDHDGKAWRLDGMSLLSVVGAQAASNVQLGDPKTGWQQA